MYDLFLACSGVSTDSRNVLYGSMFFALHGEHFDGNRFAADALESGAAYAVVDDPRVAVDDRYLVVVDTLPALQRLAAHHRRALGITILAVTGTNGKTTTKELTARVLARKFNVSVTRGNLNNHIGVPLTLLSMTRGTEFGIVEMGASAEGEIRALCEIAQPDFGVITNVGRAHLEGFGSEEGVRRAKGELYDYLAMRGFAAFVADDDPVLMEMAGERPALRKFLYNDSSATGIANPLSGGYNVHNMATAVAVGQYFGVGEDEVREAIESYVPENNRSQVIETARNTVVADCYNANPSSMRAAIEALAGAGSPRRKTVILGDMRELGAYSEAEHTGVLELLEALGIDDIYLVGSGFIQALRDYHSMPGETHVMTFEDTFEARKYFSGNPLSGRLILLKGSRLTALEKLLDVL